MRGFASLILALLAAPLLGAATEQAHDDGEIEFAATNLATAEDEIGRVLAPVHINGEGPFHFIVDTGANRSALSSELVARLGLATAGSGNVHAFTGMIETPLAAVRSLRTGAVHARDMDLPVIEGTMLAGADGILGVESMGDRQLLLDFRSGALSVNRAGARLPPGRWVELGGRLRFGNLVVVDGRVGRVAVKVVIDSGANHSVANTQLRQALRSLRALPVPTTGTRLSSAAPPVVLDEAVMIPQLAFEDAFIRNVAAYVADVYVFDLWGLSDQPALVIGMDVLQHMDAMAIDYRAGSVHLLLGERPHFFSES